MELGHGVRQEFGTKLMMMRWMDDLVLVTSRWASWAARKAARRMTRVSAYGGNLKLVRTAGAEAFGFQWRTFGDVVEVKADEKWLERFVNTPGLKRKSGLYGAKQCVKGSVKCGVVKGSMMRLLDCTNCEEEDVMMMMTRMMIGMMEVGHGKRTMEAALDGMKEEASLPIGKLKEVLGWTKEEQKTFAMGYDLTAKLDELQAELRSATGKG